MSQLLEFILYGLSANIGICSFGCWPAVAGYILMSGTGESRAGILPRAATIFLRGVVFSAAKFLSVIIAAGIFYLARDAAKILFAQYRYLFNILTGSAIATLGLTLILPADGARSSKNPVFSDGNKKSNHRLSGSGNIFILGVICGFMPCGPRVAVLAAAALGSVDFYEVIVKTIGFSLGEIAAPFLIWVSGAIGSKSVEGFLSCRSQKIIGGLLKKTAGALMILSGVRFFFV